MFQSIRKLLKNRRTPTLVFFNKKMKNLKYLIILLLIFSCKEKTFANDIVLNFPKNEEMTIQKFNEDGNDSGINYIY